MVIKGWRLEGLSPIKLSFYRLPNFGGIFLVILSILSLGLAWKQRCLTVGDDDRECL